MLEMAYTTAASRVADFRPTLETDPGKAAPGEAIEDTLRLLKEALAPHRRVVREGESIYRIGDDFCNLYVLNAGYCKMVNLTADGREQVVALKFRGDWLGFDGIADQHYTCDAVATDVGEIWVIPYQSLLTACVARPALLTTLHGAMSREIASDRDSLMSVCTLGAEARVADFLRYWAESIARRGLRSDQITLRMSRAEMGNYLGMTLETVSRSLSHLAKEQLIQFVERGRRNIRIPCVRALQDYVARSHSSGLRVLQ